MEWKPPWYKENIWLKRLTFSREVANPRTEEIHTIDFEVWKKLEDGSWAEVALSNRGDTLKSLGVHLDLLEPRDNKKNDSLSRHVHMHTWNEREGHRRVFFISRCSDATCARFQFSTFPS